MKKINLLMFVILSLAWMLVGCDVDDISSYNDNDNVKLIITCDVKIPKSQEFVDRGIAGYDYLDNITLKKGKENISHAYVYFNYSDVDDGFTNELFDADFSITNVNEEKRSCKIVAKVVSKKLIANNGRKFYITFVNDSNGIKLGDNLKPKTIVNCSDVLNYNEQIKIDSTIELNAVCDDIYANVNLDVSK